MASTAMSMASLMTNLRIPEGVNPVPVSLPNPPKLEGALKPNNVLSQAVKFADNMVSGPESLVISKGYVYTGVKDGNVVVISPAGRVQKIRRMSLATCGRTNTDEGVCGRPLGLRAHKGWLIVADAYRGIVALNPVDTSFQILVDGNQVVKGKKLGGPHRALAVSKDGSIYFSQSSSKYTRKDYLNVILEAETTGRVLVYNPRFPGRNKVRELVTTLNFPNGIQLSKDEKYLLIAEGGRARIHKAYIDPKDPKYGSIEIFAENLPGFVDNIRLSPRGTLWVGLSRLRSADEPSVLDEYGNMPNIRGALIKLPRETVLAQAPSYGIVVELDMEGNILRSLHDPTGSKYVAVSEIEEDDGKLYIGSFDKNFVGVLRVADLPPIYKPEPNGTDPNQQLKAFLDQIRARMTNMGLTQVRDIVIALVQNLVQVKLDALKAQKKVEELQKEVTRLQGIIDSTQGSATTAAPPPATTAAGPQTTQAPAPATTQPPATTQAPAPATTQAPVTASPIQTTAAAAKTTVAQAATTAGGGAATTAAGTTSGNSGTTQVPATTAVSATTAAPGSGTTASGGGITTQAGTTAGGGVTTTAGSGTTAASGGVTTAAGTTAAGTTAGSAGSGTTAAPATTTAPL